MLTMRCAHALPIGATVVDCLNFVYWKIAENLWDDCTGEYGHQRTDNEIDKMMADEGAEHSVMDLRLKTQRVAGWDVEEDDYVVITLDFLRELAEDGTRGGFFVPTSSQQLWHVAGWVHHGDDGSNIVLDSDKDNMFMLARLYRGHADGDSDMAPLEITVEADDTFEVVIPGQRHGKFGYEWEPDFYEFIPPRSL